MGWIFKICLFWFSLSAEPIALPHRHHQREAIDDRSDLPFMSHLTFMKIADFVLDANTPFFDPDWVMQGDVIYVDPDYVCWFEAQIHDRIQVPYILIARVDEWFTGDQGKFKKLLYDPKLAAWFCWNLLFSFHPKLFPIPMGQGVLAWTQEGPEQLLKRMENPPMKRHLLYMNHCPRSFGDRDRLVALFEEAPYCFSRNRRQETFKMIPKGDYLDDLAASYFVLSPIGYGIECWRTWEAIALGSIPILLHSFLDPLYEGLPVLLLHEWEEIHREFLWEKYKELSSLKSEKGYFAYWERQILDAKARAVAGDFSHSQWESTLFASADLDPLIALIGDRSSLLYKGVLTTLRPQQLLSELPSLKKMYLSDPWGDAIFFDEKERMELAEGPAEAIFLDLTYFHSSLLRNKETYYQHSLKRDIEELYASSPVGTLLFGNRLQIRYVKEVMEQISDELGVQIAEKGDFWVIYKQPIICSQTEP